MKHYLIKYGRQYISKSRITGRGMKMKNELTVEEWLALAAYLENPKQSWILSGKVKKRGT